MHARPVLSPDLLSFIRSSIRSVWALELLLLLRNRAPAAVGLDELARELRATPNLVSKCLDALEAAGLIVCEPDRSCRYAPAAPVFDTLSAALEQAYRERPVGVVDAILSAPDHRLKSFADAFRFKEKDE
jgi:predicted transcriptional regulator